VQRAVPAGFVGLSYRVGMAHPLRRFVLV